MAHTKGDWRIVEVGHPLDREYWIVNNQNVIAKISKCNDDAESNAYLIAAAPALLEACRAWMKVESEMLDNHPCPDLLLRAQYRKEAVILTKAAIAQVEKE